MLFLATLACTVTVELACAPYCEDRGAVCPPACTLDSTVWVRATYSGDCGGPPAWSVTPGHPDGWINGSHRDPDAVECGEDEYGGTLWCASRAWVRGPAGRYVVRATAPGGDFDDLEIVLPQGGALAAPTSTDTRTPPVAPSLPLVLSLRTMGRLQRASGQRLLQSQPSVEPSQKSSPKKQRR